MVARTIVIDSGGTARQVRRMFVVDSGGTTRLIKRMFVIDSGGTARLVHNGPGNVSISNALVQNFPSGGTPQTASYTLGGAPDRTIYFGVTPAGSWIDTPSTPELFECRATLVSGTPTAGTFGSWLILTSDRTWALTGFVSATVVFTLEIRLGATVVDTATVTLELQSI